MEASMRVPMEAEAAPTRRPPAGAVVYNGHCYDRRLNRCRVFAVADGEGGMEWRVAREGFDPDSEVERCFPSYAEAMRWLR